LGRDERRHAREWLSIVFFGRVADAAPAAGRARAVFLSFWSPGGVNALESSVHAPSRRRDYQGRTLDDFFAVIARVTSSAFASVGAKPIPVDCQCLAAIE